jgi:hypothetical protein
VARLGDRVGAICNICGGAEFEPGPNGRLAPNGLPPRCVSCGSLERHRGLRRALVLIPPETFAGRRALQFAPDSSLEDSWFESLEKSRYGRENSIDLSEAIDRPDDSYDFISLSLVLEFVPDDRKAFDELLRIGSNELILHVTFTSGLADQESWHRDHAEGYGTYHGYGWDFEEWFGTAERGLSTLVFEAPDPVTGDATYPFCFFFRRRGDAETFVAALEASPDATIRSYNPVPVPD